MEPPENIDTPLPGELSQLTIDEDRDPNTPEAPSPNAMMVDAPEEHLVEPNGGENDNNVAIINPDLMESDTLLATDCMFNFPVLCGLPPSPTPPPPSC